jgi:hypothetical protein
MAPIDQKAHYFIKVQGPLDKTIIDWYGPVNLTSSIQDGGAQLTTLSGLATDQGGLIGLIRRLHGLGVVIESIEREPFSAQ